MKGKAVSGTMLTLLLIGMLTLVFDVQPVRASGTVYIRADGSVAPDTAPISSVDNVTYTFTDNIYDSIVVQRNNIVVDGAGYTLQGTGASYSKGISLTDRSNVTIKNMEIKSFCYGIYLWLSSNSSISGNNITANDWYGIRLDDSSGNSISGNNIANNGDGISLVRSSNNSVSGNNIANNQVGIDSYVASNCSISGNNIANNGVGVYLWGSSYNKFYHNNFIDNTQQVYDYSWDNPSYPPSINIWDDGYPSGGNYWSDHVTVDDYSGVYQDELGSDGIVDEPYIIDGYNRDNYPLVRPFPSPVRLIRELIETIKSWNLPKGTENCLTKKLDDAISLLEMGNLNGAIHKLGDFINQVENDRKDLTEEQRSELIFRAQRIIDLIKG